MKRLLDVLCTLFLAGNCLAQDYPNKLVRWAKVVRDAGIKPE